MPEDWRANVADARAGPRETVGGPEHAARKVNRERVRGIHNEPTARAGDIIFLGAPASSRIQSSRIGRDHETETSLDCLAAARASGRNAAALHGVN